MKEIESNTDISKKQQKTRSLTVAESLFSGSIAGAVEVLVDHPLWTIKTRMQSGKSFTLNPNILYRGILPNATSMIPITGIQVGLNRCSQILCFSHSVELSTTQRLSSAFMAGVASAVISCPTEMIMTNMSEHGTSFYITAQRLIKHNGLGHLYTGGVATSMREGLFTMSFLGTSPILKKYMTDRNVNDKSASFVAGISSGVTATLTSQSFDTIKTCQQASSQRLSFWGATKQLYSSTMGVRTFFIGSIPRGARVVSAVTLIGYVNEQIGNALSGTTDNKCNDTTPRY